MGFSGCFALAPLAAGLLIRLFLIQHDCGHGSFFPNKHANDWVGRALGVLTVTPYDLWRRSHAIHHASSGNLDRRGIGDIKTLTVQEYFARDWRGRLCYRLYRHPLVMFGVGPAYTFIIESRLPFGFMRKGPMPWVSTMTTNAGIALAAGLLILCVGFTTFVIVHVPIVVLAATMGVWLFYVQHQFEATTWDGAADWSQPEAALHGSSHYDLPLPLRWFTPISACTTCITCRAAFPFIDSRDFARLSRAPRGRPTYIVAKPRLRPSRSVGRGNAAVVVVSRGMGGTRRRRAVEGSGLICPFAQGME